MNLVSKANKDIVDLQSIREVVPENHIDVWTKERLVGADLLLPLPDACVDEIDRALDKSGDVEIPDTSDRSKFKQCDALAREMMHRLNHNAVGAVIVDRLPSEKYNDIENRKVCGMFASLVGDLMEQNYAGDTLYDVKNKSPKNPEKVRKSITNHAQPFHSDGGWHRLPAKYVGLYCVRNARSGGGSKITSMLQAFTEFAASEQAEVLIEAHPWDRQGEHAIGEPGVLMNPMFEVHKGEFLSRYYESYIRNGYKKTDDDLPDAVELALNNLREIIANQYAIRFEMESGQFQYLNNWTVLHGRESFDDNETTPADETRHVIRVWNH